MSGSRRGRSAAKMGSSDALQSQPIIAIGSTLPSVSQAPSPLDLPLVSFSVNVPHEAPQSHSGGDAANAPNRNCSIASGATTTLPSPSDSDHSSSSGDSMLRAAKSIASLTDTSQLLTALLGPSHSSAASSANSIASRHCGPTIAALPEAVGAEDFDCDSVSVTSAPVKPKSAPRSKEANMRKRRRREINRTKPIAECRSAPCSHTRSQPKPFHFWQASWGDASQVVRRQFREANLLSCFYRCGAKPLARFRRTSPELTVKCLEIRLDDTFCLNLSNSKKEDPEGKFIEFVAQHNPDVSIVFAAGPVHQGRSVRVSESNNKIKPSFLRDRTKTAKGARSSSTCICPRPNTPFGCNHLDGCPKDRYLDVYVIIGNNTRACLPQDPSFKLTVEWSLGFCGKDPMNYQKFDLEGAEDKEDSSNSESQSDHESDMASPSPSTASSSSSKPRSKPRPPKAKQAAANVSPLSMPTASSSVPKAETSRKTEMAKGAKAAKRRAPSKRHKAAEVSVTYANHSAIDISTELGFLHSHPPREGFGEPFQITLNYPSSPDSGVAETVDGEVFPLQISQPMDAYMDNESEATEMSEGVDSSALETRSYEDIRRAPGRASSFLPIQFDEEDSSSVDSVQNSPCGRTEASVNQTSHSATQLLPRSLTMENQERSAFDYLFPSAARAPTLDLMSLPDWSGTADAVEYTQDSSTSSDRR